MTSVAVCIPVADDADGLQTTLAAIDALGREADGVHVVVAVDGADVATVSVAQRHGATVLPLPERRGSYAARNAALDVVPAGVEVVLFTDAGCLPQPGWVSAHLDALRTAELSGGAVEVTMSARPTPAEWVDAHRNLRQQAYVDNDGFAATCNLGVRRDVADALRFDDRLRSGGDRDFGVRARAAGHRLVYTPDAPVQHPARTTSAAVLAKARRVAAGVAELPRSSRPSRLPSRRPGLALVHRARVAGASRSPWWLLRVAWLDARRARTVVRAARAVVVDLHVVVLLLSRWDALETFSTRWREVVREWNDDPRVGALTVVDHPTLGRRALLRRHLVTEEPSWLSGVQRLRLTVPVNAQRHRTDAFGRWRAARALRRHWPRARRRVVVATTPFSAPLLPLLDDARTTTAFDAVDLWNLRRQFAHLSDRVEDGYRAAARAGAVTAVAASLADEMRALGATDPQVVANGVDLEALRTSPPPAHLPLPETPFAVYVGTVGGRLDLDLLDEAARRAADVPVVVAGPAVDEETERRLQDGPVHWLGRIPAQDIPGLLRVAGCGLLPYRDTGLFEALDSMKLLQYLAAGLPVVSTPLPGAPDGVRVAADPAAFAAAMVEATLAPRTSASPLPLQSWGEVAGELLSRYLSAAPR
ncbi:MAG TPA: glycosyltransferase [Mycobacteriales bacterium]|nr:glycosyltransferase [Mycobacteriales bacterium]